MPVGKYKRTEEHKKIIARGMRKVWRERREKSEEKSEQVPDGRDKSDGTSGRIENLDREQLLDALAQCREDILMRVKILSDQWNNLISMQQKRETLEERLSELGS